MGMRPKTLFGVGGVRMRASVLMDSDHNIGCIFTFEGLGSIFSVNMYMHFLHLLILRD